MLYFSFFLSTNIIRFSRTPNMLSARALISVQFPMAFGYILSKETLLSLKEKSQATKSMSELQVWIYTFIENTGTISLELFSILMQ
jgi:hypothetical protein